MNRDRYVPRMPPDWEPENPIEAETDGSAVAIVFGGFSALVIVALAMWWWA